MFHYFLHYYTEEKTQGQVDLNIAFQFSSVLYVVVLDPNIYDCFSALSLQSGMLLCSMKERMITNPRFMSFMRFYSEADAYSFFLSFQSS
jgi:hypothetical protein